MYVSANSGVLAKTAPVSFGGASPSSRPIFTAAMTPIKTTMPHRAYSTKIGSPVPATLYPAPSIIAPIPIRILGNTVVVKNVALRAPRFTVSIALRWTYINAPYNIKNRPVPTKISIIFTEDF